MTLQDFLVCPDCLADLQMTSEQATCTNCNRKYPRTETDQLDFRLQKPISRKFHFQIGEYVSHTDFEFHPIDKNSECDLDITKSQLPQRISPALVSHLPPFPDSESYLLDLGCGAGTFRPLSQSWGYKWVGIDITGDDPSLLADAHALPFPADFFDAAVAIKVLEHVQYPWVVLQEIARVTKPGTTLIGNVAFIEPFHADSCYHMSPNGILSLLQDTGFVPEKIGPAKHGQFTLTWGLFPYLPKLAAHVVVTPIHLLHRLWYKVGSLALDHEKASEYFRQIKLAGEFEFVAVNESNVESSSQPVPRC